MNMSSKEFLEKLRLKDSEAISYLFEQYYETLVKGALKQGLAFDQAEQVVQNTWSTFFENIKNFKGNSHIRTYLFGIMINKCKETFRDNKKYTHNYNEEFIETIFDENGSYQQEPLDPSSWIENKELNIIIQEEVNKLPDNQRLAFNLKEVEGISSKEICKILGVSNTNLGVLIYRAKVTLRIALERRLKE